MEQKEFNSSHIEQIIGYEFKNPRLLQQAFTRKSFAQDTEGFCDNEILEFYGDAALNLYTSMSMCTLFGEIKDNQYISEKNEGELSKIRSDTVCKSRLAHCIKILGLADYLFISNSDKKNEVWKSESVKEDLFESIVGAVAIDSHWNFEDIRTVCQNLLSIDDFDENYIGLLENECSKRGWKSNIFDMNMIHRKLAEQSSIPFQNLYLNGKQFVLDPHFVARIDNLKNEVADYNPVRYSTNAKSIMSTAKNVYEWLIRRDKIVKEIHAIDENLAANQLNELVQKKLIESPVFQFTETHDKDGNPIWKCTCELQYVEYPFEASDVSKKKAKHSAAAKVLLFLMGEEISKKGEEKNV